ncbi:MAG: adenylate/guanylate cyclase domain-containing protein [Candidatus Wallbacteria bacterium]|nr:adenylate/guanylate cyclase domain-containing protein [Candidatus Wallbacteria bacterium]
MPRFRSGHAESGGGGESPLASLLLQKVETAGLTHAQAQPAASSGGMPRFRSGGGPAPSADQTKATVAIMFTDIQGSTAYFAERGDDAGFEMIERHNSLLFPVLQSHGGVVIKTIGDAIMGCFEKPMLAASAAVDMQKVLQEHNRGQTDSKEQIRVRIGVHYGEAIVKKHDPVTGRPADVFGNLVNVASRIESLANGGEVFVSHDVAALTDHPIRCESLGEKQLKGVSQPVVVFRVDWQ